MATKERIEAEDVARPIIAEFATNAHDAANGLRNWIAEASWIRDPHRRFVAWAGIMERVARLQANAESAYLHARAADPSLHA